MYKLCQQPRRLIPQHVCYLVTCPQVGVVDPGILSACNFFKGGVVEGE